MLGLWRSDELRAFVAVLEEPAALADELVTIGEGAGLEVFLAGGTDAFADRLHITRRLTSRLVDELQALQLAGRVTLLVAGPDPGPLRAADVALGVEVAGEPVPWGAHLVIGSGLANVWRVIDAVEPARQVSRRSALLASAARRPAASGRSRVRRAPRPDARSCRSTPPRWCRSRWVASPAIKPEIALPLGPDLAIRGTRWKPTTVSISSKVRAPGSERENGAVAARPAPRA